MNADVSDVPARAIRMGGDTRGGDRVIVDVDLGYSPDSALALALAVCGLPVSLVVTSDEHGGERARLARHLLNALGRSNIPVVAGAELPGAARRWVCDGIAPTSAPTPGSLVDAVRWVLRGRAQVHWVGLGPMSNLATVLAEIPAAVTKMHVTQTGGRPDPTPVAPPDHRLALDPAAAAAVLRSGVDITFVLPELAQRAHLVDFPASTLHQQLGRANGPRWARTVRQCFTQWYSAGYPHTMLYAPATVAFAAGLGFIRAGTQQPLDIDGTGRLRPDRRGAGKARLADTGRCERIPRWLCERIDIAYATQLGGGIEPDLLHRRRV
ncbi:nucleoside hydrolase [Nocardia wallacei]|uniref:nucleoside hydrolase n=1 Tax=Nocardia wallacei TaxID=480035 RepID=UPI0024565EDC|nr:nucleoside hydrolase [Nocardia wallacei]